MNPTNFFGNWFNSVHPLTFIPTGNKIFIITIFTKCIQHMIIILKWVDFRFNKVRTLLKYKEGKKKELYWVDLIFIYRIQISIQFQNSIQWCILK